MEKVMDLLSLFRKGNEVANPEAWHDGGNAAALLATVLTALVKVAGDFGYGIKLDTPTAIAIASGIVAVVHVVLNNITSKSGGLLPSKGGDAAPESDPIVRQGVPAEVDLPSDTEERTDTESRVRHIGQAGVQDDAEGGNAYFG